MQQNVTESSDISPERRNTAPSDDITSLRQQIFDGFATIGAFAAAIGRKERTILRWCDLGLPFVKCGNMRLINIEVGRAWITRQAAAPIPPGRRKRVKHAA